MVCSCGKQVLLLEFSFSSNSANCCVDFNFSILIYLNGKSHLITKSHCSNFVYRFTNPCRLLSDQFPEEGFFRAGAAQDGPNPASVTPL